MSEPPTLHAAFVKRIHQMRSSERELLRKRAKYHDSWARSDLLGVSPSLLWLLGRTLALASAESS